jgi:inorganic triphosphatase YgiF
MEIELKLALPPRRATGIRRHPVLAGIKPQRRKLHSIYFDTPAFDLMRRGIALRVRRIGYHWVQTLKAEARAVGAMSSRPEWEMAVAGGASPDFAVLPQEALELLAGIKLKRIAPVFVTEFQRTTWRLVQGENQAELALDIGDIHVDGARQPISEIEIELKAGAPEFLFDLAAQLLEQTPLSVEPRSKAERGYLLCGAISPAPVKASHPVIVRGQNAGEAWDAVMQAALAQLVANVPGFLEHAHDTEYLHQIRIALRRLRAGVTLAKTLGDATPDWDAALRALMQGLNPARDWDVFLHETLPKSLTMLADEHPDEALLKRVRDDAAHTRQQAQALFRSPDFTRLMLDIGRSLLMPPATTGITDARAWAAQILEKRWLALRKRCRNFAKLDPTQRHRARIAAKKMRYAADAFASLHGKRGARFIEALAALQNGLGRSNDAHVGMQLLRALAKKSAPLRFDLGRIDGALEAEVARHAHLSGAIWQRLARARTFWRT